MKRCWFALALLVVLLAGGFWMANYMNRAHDPMVSAVGRAGEASITGNWEEARNALIQARENWDAKRKLFAVFVDHEPIEEVDALFAQLEVAARREDELGFSSLCAYLKEALKAMGEAHSPTWWNIL